MKVDSSLCCMCISAGEATIVWYLEHGMQLYSWLQRICEQIHLSTNSGFRDHVICTRSKIQQEDLTRRSNNVTASTLSWNNDAYLLILLLSSARGAKHDCNLFERYFIGKQVCGRLSAKPVSTLLVINSRLECRAWCVQSRTVRPNSVNGKTTVTKYHCYVQ